MSSARRSRACLLLILLGAALGDYIEVDVFRLSDSSQTAIRTSDGHELENGASKVEPLASSSQPRDLASPVLVPVGRGGSTPLSVDPAPPRTPSAAALRERAAAPAYLQPYLPSSPHSRRSPPA
jgi:hypothetical protein